MVSKIDELDEANVAAVGRSWATSSEKQGPDKMLKDLGLIRLSTNWDKNKDDESSAVFSKFKGIRLGTPAPILEV